MRIPHHRPSCAFGGPRDIDAFRASVLPLIRGWWGGCRSWDHVSKWQGKYILFPLRGGSPLMRWECESCSQTIPDMCPSVRPSIVCGPYSPATWHIPLSRSMLHTGCPRRNGQNFGRVFLMLNYTDITQNTYIQNWTVTELMAIEKCGLLGCPRTVRRPWRHIRPVSMPGNQTPLASIVMQWLWRDYEQLRPV